MSAWWLHMDSQSSGLWVNILTWSPLHSLLVCRSMVHVQSLWLANLNEHLLHKFFTHGCTPLVLLCSLVAMFTYSEQYLHCSATGGKPSGRLHCSWLTLNLVQALKRWFGFVLPLSWTMTFRLSQCSIMHALWCNKRMWYVCSVRYMYIYGRRAGYIYVICPSSLYSSVGLPWTVPAGGIPCHQCHIYINCLWPLIFCNKCWRSKSWKSITELELVELEQHKHWKVVNSSLYFNRDLHFVYVQHNLIYLKQQGDVVYARSVRHIYRHTHAICLSALITDPLRYDKVGICQPIIYPHKPMTKIKVVICNHQTVCLFWCRPDVWCGYLQTKELYMTGDILTGTRYH